MATWLERQDDGEREEGEEAASWDGPEGRWRMGAAAYGRAADAMAALAHTRSLSCFRAVALEHTHTRVHTRTHAHTHTRTTHTHTHPPCALVVAFVPCPALPCPARALPCHAMPCGTCQCRRARAVRGAALFARRPLAGQALQLHSSAVATAALARTLQTRCP